MECLVDGVPLHYVSHGQGRPVLVLHGGGVDHHEAEACFEPALRATRDCRRIYPDLPGMGRTPAPPSVRSAGDVLEVLAAFVDRVAGSDRVALIGHSAGAYYGQALADRHPERTAGLALVCPLLADVGDVPAHQPVVPSPGLGDEGFRDYFVVQTPAMWERYQRFVAPALGLADWAAVEQIGERWELDRIDGPAYRGPTLIVAGRQDSTVGYATAIDLLKRYPQGSLAVLDRAGHALPHEQPELLTALIREWLDRQVPEDLSASP